VSLDGGASRDADGDSLTYSWALLSSPSGSTASLTSTTSVATSFVADLAGMYVAQLIVNDGKANSPAATLVISVIDPNKPPVVHAGPPDSVQALATYTLQGTVTDDGYPPGAPISRLGHRYPSHWRPKRYSKIQRTL
jgi:hypothetical protein